MKALDPRKGDGIVVCEIEPVEDDWGRATFTNEYSNGMSICWGEQDVNWDDQHDSMVEQGFSLSFSEDRKTLIYSK